MLMAALKIQLVVTWLSVCEMPSRAQPAVCQKAEVRGNIEEGGVRGRGSLSCRLDGRVSCERSALAGCLIYQGLIQPALDWCKS